MMRLRTFYSTIVLSDIHLGTSHSKTTEVTNLQVAGPSHRLLQGSHEDDGETGYGGHLRAGQSR